MASSSFAKLEQVIQQPAFDFMQKASQGMSNALATPMKAALTLYVLWFGVLILRGSSTEPLTEFVTRVMKAGIIVTLAGNYGDYNTYVGEFFFTVVPRELSDALLGNGPQAAPASAKRFDDMLDATGRAVEEMKREAGSWSAAALWAAVCGGLAYLVMGALAAHGYFIFLFAKFALALVLGIGPLFIGLALFESTKKFCDGFMNVVAQFVVLQLLAVAVLAMMLSAIDAQFKSQIGTDASGRMLGLIATAFFCFGVLGHLPSLAQSLTHGGFFTMGQSGGARRVAGGAIGGVAQGLGSATAGTRFERAGRSASGYGQALGNSVARRAPRDSTPAVPSAERQIDLQSQQKA